MWQFTEVGNTAPSLSHSESKYCINRHSLTCKLRLEVFNGQITQARDAGILMTFCDSVDVYDLTMSQHLLDACRFTESSELSFHDINFIQSDSGERAFFFTSCDNVSVRSSVATGFLSTIGAVVQLQNCTDISMQDVNVADCTKTLAAPSGGFPDGFFNVASQLVSLIACSDFDLTRVKVNNNTSNSNQTTNTFEAIGVQLSENGSINQCETCNNFTEHGGFPGAAELAIGASSNIFVNGHQANSNICEGALQYFFGIVASGCNGIVIDGCQASNNFVSEMFVGRNLVAELSAIVCANGGNNVIRNSQASNNRAENGGVRTSWFEGGLVEGFIIDANGIVENCQALNNSLGTSGPFTMAIGLNHEVPLAVESGGCVISNSTFNNMSGGEIATGILLNTAIFGIPIKQEDTKIVNCQANSNGRYGIMAGWPPVNPIPAVCNRIELIDCTFNNNGGASGDGAGIKFFTFATPANDIFIKGCQINNTISSDSDAAGIHISNATNVVIEDAFVSNTTADTFGHGIRLDTVRDSKILRTQLHKNQNSGVELVGTNANIALIECVAIDNAIGFDFNASSTALCCLVENCKAVGNSSAGFVHAVTPLRTSFIGNKAQCNGATSADNYQLASGVINLQQLTWGTGTYTQITGVGAALGSPLANVRVVP